WSKAKRVYPHTAILARKHVAVQASSVAFERVLSVGGLVVPITRNPRSSDRVLDIVCLQENFKHNR
ncbi:unnamed protein product, partial [Sphacelaria rigidula]